MQTTTLEVIKEEQSKMLEYLLREPAKYLILFGNRSIGKTHTVIEYFLKNDLVFMYLYRKMTQQKGIQGVMNKYIPYIFGNEYFCVCIKGKIELFKNDLNIDGDPFIKLVKTIGYYDYLNRADDAKTENIDNPPVTEIIFDEVFTFNPVDDEPRKLELFYSTLNRSFGNPVGNARIWMLGNYGMGVAHVLRNIPFNIEHQNKDSGEIVLEDGHIDKYRVYYSTLNSPKGVVNTIPRGYFPEFTPKDNDIPIAKWRYAGRGYGAFTTMHEIVVCSYDKVSKELTTTEINKIREYVYKRNWFFTDKRIKIQVPAAMHIYAYLGMRL